MLKRYLLFLCDQYYPSGGWEDFVDSFDTIDEAKARAAQFEWDWADIVDTTTSKVVCNAARMVYSRTIEWSNV